MTRSARAEKERGRALKEAAKALAIAAKSLALASDALSRLYDTDEDDSCASETDNESIPAENKVNDLPRTAQKPVIDYEDSDDEYMILAREAISVATKMPGTQSPMQDNKPTWSEMQNNLGTFEVPSKGDTESGGVRTVGEKPGPRTFMLPSELYQDTFLEPISHAFFSEATINPTKFGGESMASQPPKSWASLLNTKKSGAPASAPGTRDNFDIDSTAGSNSDPKPGTKESFGNIKNRWATPTELQLKLLSPLRAGYDILLLHANLKSHVHAILIHCLQTLKRERQSSSVGVISALVIVPQQTTGRLYLQYANELLSDLGLPHKAMLLPGGGSDMAVEAERMSTERIDLLISSPRVFVNHVNSNPNLSNHLTKIRFVIYAGAHELTKSDVFLSFQFNMIKKRMATRAKSPRQIIIAAAYTDDHIQVFANRGLHPGYITVYGADSDDSLQSESWDKLLQP
ncbi:unnamed protein product [Rhizoctonia solani]|uniref:DEAD/DEAH box helicase domain-containing protein n=1 Tax=Rhizoctonia solani TaxID=456999 RepID=A0A8H3E881_9AGAM|nr:unnamed protein product [Rhizoctonia solani]